MFLFSRPSCLKLSALHTLYKEFLAIMKLAIRLTIGTIFTKCDSLIPIRPISISLISNIRIDGECDAWRLHLFKFVNSIEKRWFYDKLSFKRTL